MLCILEQLAEETVEMGPRKIHVLEHLQMMTSLVASYKRNDSYKSEQIKEILRYLKDVYKVPYKQLETIFSERKVIIGDLQLIRWIISFVYILCN